MNKEYSEKEINTMVDMFADLVIDSFIELRRKKLVESDKMKASSNKPYGFLMAVLDKSVRV